jgi:hypothetical protein
VRFASIGNTPEGPVDLYLKTFGSWDGSWLVAALSYCSLYPQTHFGTGDMTSDFVGLAREWRQQEMPGVLRCMRVGTAETLLGTSTTRGSARAFRHWQNVFGPADSPLTQPLHFSCHAPASR